MLTHPVKEGLIFFDYLKGVRAELTDIPFQTLSRETYREGDSRVISLDLSKQLQTDYAASSPVCTVNFIKLNQADSLAPQVNASSHLFYVISGSGQTTIDNVQIDWQSGDLFIAPAAHSMIHCAQENSALYWVHDAPLLNYLKVSPLAPSFKPVYYHWKIIEDKMDELCPSNHALKQNRNGIIFSNTDCHHTKSITPTLWALLNIIYPNQHQKPHRHNSIAFDFVVKGPDSGVYSLLSKKIGEDGQLINPQRVDWEPGSIFITPPGYWHSHHNESGEIALVLPVQDAGLHNYLRTLDIKFVK